MRNNPFVLRWLHTLLLLALLLGAALPAGAPAALAQATTCAEVTLHYARRNADYEGWGLHAWRPTSEVVSWDAPLAPDGTDDFGVYWTVAMTDGAEFLNYIIHKGDEKDPGPDQLATFAEIGCEFWQIQGRPDQFLDAATALAALNPVVEGAPEAGENQVIIHYRRIAGDYDGWGLHVWGPTTETVTWTSPLLPDGQDDYGIYWLVDMEAGAEVLNYIVHKGDEKDPGPDQSLDIATLGNQIWLVQGSAEQFLDPEAAKEGLLVAGIGDIKNKAQAYWLTREIIAWPTPYGNRAIFTLHYDPDGAIAVTQDGLQGGQQLQLEFVDSSLDPALGDRFPHLRAAAMLRLPADAVVEDILRGQTAISVSAPDGTILGATALQTAGVLDDLYANDEALGAVIVDGVPSLRVWAPTARNVQLQLYTDSDAATQPVTLPMTRDDATGIWSAQGEPGWLGQYYTYLVDVYVRQESRVMSFEVTDPYSFSLSLNSTRSQIVDLNDPALMPAGWLETDKPALAAPEDIVLYELHIRDFSALDQTVPAEMRGTYMAFTQTGSDGMQHLQRLSNAGVTHIHLLPAFDIATINEDKSAWATLDTDALAALPPDSEQQQEITGAARGQDGYNWGYDPFHYTAPEGSYATDPNGAARIREFRAMVQSLNQTGLRVVMDVVYNHTNASGVSEKAVLDKLVPGYYHRLDSNGNVATSTCCANTATENVMMEKLMLDSLYIWATQYKVDGFRFDLMGHHMKSNMEDVRAMLDSLTLESDGVDGQAIYVYGEGWDFGEVASNARGVNATQLNLGGTGIGTFNDRLRDAVRGGNPFRAVTEQGFASGLFTAPNGANTLPLDSQRAQLLELSDQIKISLAGNLADYLLINYEGIEVTGSLVNYNGAPAGYTSDPQENIIYTEAHDNETYFDAMAYKLPEDLSIEQRLRVQMLGVSLTALSQGVPFFHAGQELMRSKSLDRDSYDSGDWFNHLDYTYESNNWGVGLPPRDKNGSNYPVMAPLLANPEIKPSPAEIQASMAHFEEMLRIRKSTPLFRLQTAQDIQERVLFYNNGKDQTPGLIVMAIQDPGAGLDPSLELVISLFNAAPETVSFTLAELQNASLVLHPILQESADAVVKSASFDAASNTFTIPGRTTAVFTGMGTLSNAPAVTAVEVPAEQPDAEPVDQPDVEEPAAETPAQDAGQPVWPWAVAALGGAGLAGALWLAIRRRGQAKSK